MYGPTPAGVFCPSMAKNTLRPKKNGSPQSKLVASEFVPARLLNAKEVGLAESSESVFATLKRTWLATPSVPWFVAIKSCVAAGQSKPTLLLQRGMPPSAKKSAFEPESIKLLL